MKSVCEILSEAVEVGKQYLNIGGAWGRIWNTSPAYILSSIPIINVIFIASKAKQIKDMASSSTLNAERFKILEFTQLVKEYMGYASFAILPIGSLLAFMEAIILDNMRQMSWMWKEHQISKQAIRTCMVLFGSFFVAALCMNFLERKLSEIKGVCPNPKPETINDYLRAAKSVAEVKAIIDFFKKTYGRADLTDFFGSCYGCCPGKICIFENATLKIAKYLVEERGCKEIVLLHFATDIEAVKYLVEKGAADVDATIVHAHSSSVTALFWVNNLEIAQYLVSKGADLHALSGRERTPLTDCGISAVSQCFSVSEANRSKKIQELINRIKILLTCGADPQHEDGKGLSLYKLFAMCKYHPFRA